MAAQEQPATVPAVRSPQKLTDINKQLAVRRGTRYAAGSVPHLSLDDVRRMIEVVKPRDQLLIRLLFDGCLRVSEALGVRPRDIQQTEDGWVVNILGKGGKRGQAAISGTLAALIHSYCYRLNIPQDQPIFRIKRPRVHQVVAEAMRQAGVVKPDGVGTIHVLRHSGALERLRRTGNPKALQDQLRHSTPQMTLRYMKTLSQEESLAIQQEVDLQWV